MPNFSRVHRGHTHSLRIASRILDPGLVKKMDDELGEVYRSLQDPVMKCESSCPAYKEGVCQSTGKAVSEGAECTAQIISKEVSRG